jgi:hypothetical protein
MAEMYNRPIHIYSYSTEPINIFHGSYETDLPPIRLSYHRSNHYNSLLDPCNPAVGAGLGFGSLRGVGISFFSVLLRNPNECFLSLNYVASSSTKVVTIFLFTPLSCSFAQATPPMWVRGPVLLFCKLF